MKIVVDYDQCASNGVCMGILPEIFEVRDDGFLYVLNDHPDESLRDQLVEAVNSCPDGCDLDRRGLTRGRATRPDRAVADRLLPRRQRAHRAVQLALRQARTAGRSCLRIEDTDEERNREEWVDGIIDALELAGARRPTSRPCARASSPTRTAPRPTRLLAAGVLYGCDCTREAIDARLKGTGRTGYDGHCRDRGLATGTGRRAALPGPRRRA